MIRANKTTWNLTLGALGLCCGSTAFAVCTNTPNSIAATNNSGCTAAGGTYTPTVGWTTFMSAGYGGILDATGDMNITVTSSSTYNPFSTTGVGVGEVRNSVAAQINAQSITLDMTTRPSSPPPPRMPTAPAAPTRTSTASA